MTENKRILNVHEKKFAELENFKLKQLCFKQILMLY